MILIKSLFASWIIDLLALIFLIQFIVTLLRPRPNLDKLLAYTSFFLIAISSFKLNEKAL